MPAYDSAAFRPPAPIALVTCRSPASGSTVSNVLMLLDTGADVSLLPRGAIAELIDGGQELQEYELEAFDGTKSVAAAVSMEIELLGKSFRGQYLLGEQTYGVLGRNILNALSLVLDGPTLTWKESR